MNYTFKNALEKIIADDALHARFLNTLSLMENVGARKISRYEHPVHTNITVLKHAAEEARHAYYLKKQIGKLGDEYCPDYAFDYLLAPFNSYQYLHRLDVAVCRYLKETLKLSGRAADDAAYILVTYAIEVRADELYGTYQDLLTAAGSKVNVKSIIMEEAGHLEEMTRMLEAFRPDWKPMADAVCAIEDSLYQEWVKGLAASVNL